MKQILTILQMIFSLLLVTTILLQSRGAGLGSAWGGSGESYHSKKGVERILFTSSIVLAILFLLTSIASLVG